MSDTIPEASAETPAAPPAEKEDKGSALWREIKGLLWVLLAVLAFHSFVAKPFYIPSEIDDAGPAHRRPAGGQQISLRLFVGQPELPRLFPDQGRLFGKLPKRGDIVIVTPPGTRTDYIKRVIGLPGDTVRMIDGQLVINGQPVKRVTEAPDMVAVDANSPCGSPHDPALYDFRVQGADGKLYCRVPIVRETLPSGRTYETVELGRSTEDNFGPVTVPAGHLWLMGDNRDDSADSRVPEWQGGLGGPVPWENIGGRAEFITFSLDGTSVWWNPLTWFEALRSGRAGRSLRNS